MTDREIAIILNTIEKWTGPHLLHMPQGTSAVLVSELSDRLYGTKYPRAKYKQAEYERYWALQGRIQQARTKPTQQTASTEDTNAKKTE